MEINVERDGRSITGRVRGERRTPYLTRVNIVNGRGGRIRLSSTCTCLVYSECEHAAATLLAALDETAAPDADEVSAAIDPELEAWIAAINQSARAQTNGHASDGADCVLYVLEPAQRLWRDAAAIQPLAVSTFRARRLRGGLYGREHPLAMSNLVAEDPASFVAVDDQVIGRLLGAPNAQTKRLGSVGDGDTLRRMLETGRCHWRNGQGPALSYEEPRAGRFGWQFDSEGQQHVVCELEDARAPTWSSSAWASPGTSTSRSSACGRIETSVPHRVTRLLLRGAGRAGRRRQPGPPEAAAQRRDPASCPSPCASASGWRCARRRSCICTARGSPPRAAWAGSARSRRSTCRWRGSCSTMPVPRSAGRTAAPRSTTSRTTGCWSCRATRCSRCR